MKKTLALVFAIVMVISSCLPVGAITLETVTDALPETVVETPAAEDTELSAAITTPETAVSQYGKLIFYRDYEQENATKTSNAYLDPDYITSAGHLYTTSHGKFEVVPNPDSTVGGKVLDMTKVEGQSHAYFTPEWKWNTNFVANGDFRVVFDMYTTENQFGFVHQGWNNWGGITSGDARKFDTVGKWATIEYSLPYTVSVDYSTNEFGTFTHGYQGKTQTVVEADASNKQPFYNSFGFVYGVAGNIYLDNLQLWYFPKNAVVINNGGVYSMVEFDASKETFMLPAANGVTGYTNGIEFYDVNYPVLVSEFYGKDLVLTATNEVFYDDEKGELLTVYDFESGNGSPHGYVAKYLNGNFFSVSGDARYTNEWSNGYGSKPVIVEAGTSNHALEWNIPSGTSVGGMYYTATKMDDTMTGHTAKGTVYTIDFDIKAVQIGEETVAQAYPTTGSYYFNGSGNDSRAFSIEGISFDNWKHVSHKHELNSEQTKLKTWALGISPKTGFDINFLMDDLKIYFFPQNKIHIKESASSSKVYTLTADANGNVVIPTKEQIGFDHLKGALTEFKAADGTTLAVGSTVAAATYAAKTYYPVLETAEATFVYGTTSKVLDLGEGATFTMPNLSALDNSLQDVASGAWLVDKNTMYDIGETVSVAAIKGKTISFVNLEVNNEYGKLVYYMDFEDENSYLTSDSLYSLNNTDSVYAYYDANYIQKVRVDSRSTFPYFGMKDHLTRVENPNGSGYVLKTKETGGRDFLLNFAWSPTGASTLINETGRYTVVYDVLSDTTHGWQWCGWKGPNASNGTSLHNHGTNFTAGANWNTHVTATAIQAVTDKANATYKIVSVKEGTNPITTDTTHIYNYTWYADFGDNVRQVYFDNIRIYYSPAVNFEYNGEVVGYELGQDVTATLPAFNDVFPGKNTAFAGWKVGETVYAAGATVNIADLIDANVTAVVSEYYVTFNGQTATVAVDAAAENVVLPALTDVDADWTTAKAYLIDGVLYAPGETVATADVLEKTIAAIASEKSNASGTLILYYDFDAEGATTNTYAYKNAALVGTTGSFTNAQVSADPAGVTGNNVLKVTAHDTAFTVADMFTKNGVYTVKYDGYAAANNIVFGNSTWRTGTGSTRIGADADDALRAVISVTANEWARGNTVESVAVAKTASGYSFRETSGNFTTATNANGLAGFVWYGYNVVKADGTGAVKEIYFDNVSFYYAPLKANFVLNGEVVAKDIEGDATVYTLPEFKDVYPESNEVFYAWNVGGTNYAPGQTVTVETLMTNDIVAATNEYYLMFNGVKGTASVSDVTLDKQVLPEFTSVNAAWTNAKSYLIGGTLYVPGDEVATSSLIGSTITVIDAEAFSVENGILLAYNDFEQGNVGINLYVNSEYNASMNFSPDGGSTFGIVEKPDAPGNAFKLKSGTAFFVTFNNNTNLSGKSGTVKIVYDTSSVVPGWCAWRTSAGYIYAVNTAPHYVLSTDANTGWKTVETVTLNQTYENGSYTMTQPNQNEAKTTSGPVASHLFYNAKDGVFDNLRLYFYPTDRLYFAAEEGATPTSVVATNGKVTVPTPAALGMNINATHWVSADGLATLEFGAEVDVAIFAETVYYPVASIAPVADEKVDFNQLRDGLRFKATVTGTNKQIMNEYGFLFARETILDGAELTFDFTADGVKKAFISEYAYLEGERDYSISTDTATGDTTFAMTAFGIPEASRDEVLVARPYAKYFVNEEEVTVYGAQVTATYNSVSTTVVQG